MNDRRFCMYGLCFACSLTWFAYCITTKEPLLSVYVIGRLIGGILTIVALGELCLRMMADYEFWLDARPRVDEKERTELYFRLYLDNGGKRTKSALPYRYRVVASRYEQRYGQLPPGIES